MKNITDAKELQKIVVDLGNFKLEETEAQIIMGYFEGHDYMIKADTENLFVVDVTDESDICKEMFEDIVCRVIGWNNELIEFTNRDISKLYATLDQHDEFAKLASYLLGLEEDEKKLDALYTILTREGIGADIEQEIIKGVKILLKDEISLSSIEELDITKIGIIGSRKNGRYRENSDLDILIEYKNDLKEYVVFNMLNDLGMEYDGLCLDFFPVCKYEIK